MNCADTVYAQPEEPGEAVDPDYQRFIPGLGLLTEAYGNGLIREKME